MSEKASRRPRGLPTWDPATGDRPLLGAVDEDVVDMPTRQTLGLLGVICASTLIMWAAGRAACNYHVPGEGLTPRAVTLEERTKSPKDVGIELAQALSGANFSVAEQLIEPSAASLLTEARTCGECKQEIAAREELLSVAEVLAMSRTEAHVVVKTTGGPAGEVERVFLVRRDPSRKPDWQVTAQLPSREQLPELPGALSPEQGPSLRQVRQRVPGHPPLRLPESGDAASKVPPASPSAEPGPAAPPTSPPASGTPKSTPPPPSGE